MVDRDSRKSRGSIFFTQDPDNPANDGELTDTEIRKMKLTQTRLAVLAACETGFIDIIRLPDEFSGLIESLLPAGCSTVVASLWPVAADITSATTKRDAYAAHTAGRTTGKRESPAQALRRVQLALRNAAQPTYGGHWFKLPGRPVSYRPFLSVTRLRLVSPCSGQPSPALVA